MPNGRPNIGEHALGRPRLACYKELGYSAPGYAPGAAAGQELVMRRGKRGDFRLNRIVSIAALTLLTACSSSGNTTSDSGSSLSSMFGAKPSNAAPLAAAAPVAGSKPLESCPNVELRQGAGTLTINNNPRDPSAMQLRYQVAIMQTSRECAQTGGTLTIRVGVQGRIVLGPAGTHGSLEIPLRYALVEEGSEPKTIYTKLYRIPVAIPEGSPNVAFTHIEESISVPMPSFAVFDKYVIYVGFDALGAAEQRRPAPKKRNPKQS